MDKYTARELKMMESLQEIEQILAQAIGRYPWYKDDQKNFPGSTEKDGVCVGEHVPETLAQEAANIIRALRVDEKEAYDNFRACQADNVKMALKLSDALTEIDNLKTVLSSLRWNDPGCHTCFKNRVIVDEYYNQKEEEDAS